MVQKVVHAVTEEGEEDETVDEEQFYPFLLVVTSLQQNDRVPVRRAVTTLTRLMNDLTDLNQLLKIGMRSRACMG